jgi:hypothetical protein
MYVTGSVDQGRYDRVDAVQGRTEGDTSIRAAGSGSGEGDHTDTDIDPYVSLEKTKRKKTQRSYSTRQVEVHCRRPV